MKKVVFKLDVHEDKFKQKVMKAVSGLSGVKSVSVDMKDKKLTVIGDIDPVRVVRMLRKFCHAEIIVVGPASATDPLMFYGTHAYYNHHMKPHYSPYCYYRVVVVEEDPNSCVIV